MDDSAFWLMHCAAEGIAPPSPDRVLVQVERLAADGYATVSDDPVVWALAFEEPSRAVLLTEKGKAVVDTYSERLGSEVEEQRAIEFVRALVLNRATHLRFQPALPAYLPSRFSLLPDIDVDDASNRLYLKYYGGEDHLILAQGSEESWATDAFESRDVHGVKVWSMENRETSLWVSITTRWVVSQVNYRLTCNWLHQLSSAQPEREPIALDDSKRMEAWAVTESVIAEAIGN
jgi:hypothetical protein